MSVERERESSRHSRRVFFGGFSFLPKNQKIKETSRNILPNFFFFFFWDFGFSGKSPARDFFDGAKKTKNNAEQDHLESSFGFFFLVILRISPFFFLENPVF